MIIVMHILVKKNWIWIRWVKIAVWVFAASTRKAVGVGVKVAAAAATVITTVENGF